MKASEDQIRALLERALELTQQIRSDTEDGRLDLLSDDLESREQVLREFASHVPTPDLLEGNLADLLRANRQAHLELLVSMKASKEQVASRLQSLRHEGTDPFRERPVGANLLDQRV